MAKTAVYVTVFFATLSYIAAYDKQCAVGPQYWCQSFQNAESCGAIRHCTDTVWQQDEKYAVFESSTTCEWCRKILENSHTGIQHLANNEDLIKSSMEQGCRLFPLDTLSNTCSNTVKQYGSVAAKLIKSKRYSTVCHLMKMCSIPPVTQAPPTVDLPLVGQKRCTWGPAYWCSSLSNSRECKSIEQCSNEIWSKQVIEQQSDDKICKFCAFTMDKMHSIIEEKKTEIDVKNWLTSACSMLQIKDLVDECNLMVSEYAEEVLVLVKSKIDPGVICHLAHMCKDATIKAKQVVAEIETKPATNIEYKPPVVIPVDEESKMLCHVIVRATHDLHVNEHQSRAEIQSFLRNDCQKFPNLQLIAKCHDLVHRYATEIYAHVASGVELSKVCDYLDDFIDETKNTEMPQVHCELCNFVIATTKYMKDAKFTDEKVLSYVDEQVCSRLTGNMKKGCQDIVLNKGKELMDDIQSGMKPTLICLRFQICIESFYTKTNELPLDEIKSFLNEKICNKMGPLEDTCHALFQSNEPQITQTLIQDLEGDILCRLLGLCPKRLSFLDDLSTNDDKNKCKRCIDDFTRRKHISEKLVNHSAEFLRHLCSQLPEKDQCTQAVDDSIQELIDFVRALDPQDICIELKMCDSELLKKIEPTTPDESEPLFTHEIIEYLKVEFCMKMGEMTSFCNASMDSFGPNILQIISKEIDPKKACQTMGVCPTTNAFDNCNDKCECCMGRMETHQTQINTFFHSMVNTIRAFCIHMPQSDSCLKMVEKLDAQANKISLRLNPRKACQLLTHCSELPVQIETLDQCRSRMNSKQEFLVKSVQTLNRNFKSLCEYIPWNKDCYAIIDRSTYDVEEVLSQLDTETICSSRQSLTEIVCQKSPFKKLCHTLVEFDENHSRLEALFTSMFNQNGRVENELCELDEELVKSDVCKTSFKTVGNQDQCVSCNKFYADKKTFDLTTIENLREGLLLTCDWSLLKDHCISWFNRVCDRMKNKVDKFEPKKYCQNIRVCSEKSTSERNYCSDTDDKCGCCKKTLNVRKDRFRGIVDEMTNVLLLPCNEDNCRSSVKETQKQSLNQIDRINIEKLCQRYGYCSQELSSELIQPRSRLSDNPHNHIGSSIEALSQRLDTALTSDICFQYGQLRHVCEHLLASTNGHRHAYIYRALLHKNQKLFDDDLREQLASPTGSDVCTVCKNAVQTTKDFWLNSLDQIRDVLIQSCERCPVKDQCQAFFNQQYENIKTYINTIDSDQFCQSLSLCSSKPVVQLQTESGSCNTCIQRLNQRKEVLRLGVDRLTNYLTGICQRFELKPCQNFLQQLKQTFQTTINTWNSEEICTHVGFCSTTGSSSTISFDQYETYLKTQFENEICSDLGPFQTWCQQMLNGNHEQIQTVKINENLRDLMQIGESKDENLLSAVNQYKCENDRCECCIDRINRKKNYLKYRATQVFKILIQACDYCPVKDQCQKYWTDEENKCLPSIDNIDSKQTCVQMGFCNASSLCSKMGVFQEECEHVLNNFIQLNQQEKAELVKDLPKTSVVVLSKEETKTAVDDSKTNCILCEYMMKILSKYIHQGSTEEEIEKSLEQVCNRMPSNLKQQCDEFIENYGSVIIATLVQELDLTKLCKKLNICTKTMNFQVESLSKPNMAACGICDYVSTYVHFALKRNPSDASLQEALSKVCTHLSSEQTSQCEMLVQLFGPQMRHLQLDLGENFCQHLAICESVSETSTSKTIVADKIIEDVLETELDKTPSILDNPETREKIVKNLDETPQCLICRYAVSYLDAVLKNNKSEEAIQEALAKVCKLLPEKERAECNEFIKTYGPVLAELIVDLADPDSVCRYLGVCQVVLPSESTVKTPKLIGGDHHDYVNHVPKETTYTCTICQFVVTRMKGFIELNQTEEEILASMKSSCDLFSVVHLKQQCLDFLDKYGPYLIQMVSSDIDPKEACENIGACEKTSPAISYEEPKTTSPSPKSSTVAGKCIFGMSYWCTSRQNAELCNAVELCEQLVWSSKSKNIVI